MRGAILLICVAAVAAIGDAAAQENPWENASEVIENSAEPVEAPPSSYQARRAELDQLERDLKAAIEAQKNTPTVGDVLYRGLRKFHGKPQKRAFDTIGYPDKKMLIGNEVIYSWVNTTSNIDGGPLSCTVKVIVRQGTIVNTDFSGNNGACERYAKAVDPSFRGLP